MKTPVKILILVIVFLGLISGIFIFAKTRISPPKDIETINQFANRLQSDFEVFDSISDYNECRKEYLKIDDKLTLLYTENIIDSEIKDEYKGKINDKFGDLLISHSFDMLKKSVWPEDQINDINALISQLKNEKLISGDVAVSDNFIKQANNFNSIINSYREALRFSKNTSFNGISDASSKIAKVKKYLSQPYLKNNAVLVNALNAMPKKIAQSHYNSVSNIVSSLNNYHNVPKEHYVNTLIPHADKAIQDYKNTKIYGGSKPGISSLEDRAGNMVKSAMNYYGNINQI